MASKKRSPALPDVPSFEELGLNGMDAPLWIGAMAPRGTPPGIIAKLHGEFAKALATKDVQERLAAQSAEVIAAGPKEFEAMIETLRKKQRDEITQLEGIIARAKGSASEEVVSELDGLRERMEAELKTQ